MAAVLLVLAPSFAAWLRAGLWQRVGNLLGLVVTGIVVYLLALFTAGLRPHHVRDLLERGKTATEGPAP
jgi:peptidoglycan biosynthesis protein MviN/MurJ (putative lipid II flippase)